MNSELNLFDEKYLLKLASAKMPFGKYAGTYLADLPEQYVLWFSQKGFPPGELGSMLKQIKEIKANGMEFLLKNIRLNTTKYKGEEKYL